MPHRPSREVEAIVAGRHDDPFAFLGMHKSAAGIFVRAMLPDAVKVTGLLRSVNHVSGGS